MICFLSAYKSFSTYIIFALVNLLFFLIKTHTDKINPFPQTENTFSHVQEIINQNLFLMVFHT